jgi:hypothetical protein
MRVLNTSGWPETTLDVLKDLHLDPKNVRLEVANAQVEADIMEDLFVNEDVLGLVEGIARVGYLTHELPIAVKRKKSFVVVEGNRRLAALKAIQNPQLVPEFRARVAALAAEIPDRSSLSSVRVLVAPGDAEAEQLIAAIHTSNLRRPWSPARQAAFFQAQIDSGRSFKTLVQRYPTIDVRRFVFRALIINEFRRVKYSSAELTDFLRTKSWNRGLSVLARIYESKEFLDLTGLAMDAEGKLTKSVSDRRFSSMAAIIVQGMLDGSLNTRSLNTVHSPRFNQLMNELRDIAGKPREGGSGSGAAGNGSGGQGSTRTGSSAGGTKSTSTKRSTSKKRQFLDLGFVVPKTYPRALHVHVEELSALNVQRFPNSVFLLMRAVLEKSIKAFAEERGEDIKGSGNNDKGRVQLGHALAWLLQYVTTNGPKNLVQPITRVRSGKLTYMASKDSLDAINHNHHFAVDPDEAFHMWDSLDSIVRYVMKP